MNELTKEEDLRRQWQEVIDKYEGQPEYSYALFKKIILDVLNDLTCDEDVESCSCIDQAIENINNKLELNNEGIIK